MKLEDITIIDFDFPPYPIADKPSNLTMAFLSSIIHSPYFKSELKYFREEYLISDQGLSIDHLRKTFQPDLYEFMKWELKYLLFYYDLSFQFMRSLYFLIVFNAFVDITEDNFSSILYLENPSDVSKVTSEPEEPIETFSAILFYHKMSKNQLLSWLEINWDKIYKSMDYYLPSLPADGNKFENIEISDKILALSKKKYPIKKICDLLSKEYPENENVIDEGWVKNKLSRYKKRIDYISKKRERLNIDPLEDE
jgi:hypothetical protein